MSDDWITVAAAAKALTASGDPITAPNVSRYLARFPDLPQRKEGKYRLVDLAALAAHRKTNVLVGEKRASRDLPAEPPPPPKQIAPAGAEDAEEEDEGGGASGDSALGRVNLRIKQIRMRNDEIDLAVKEGGLVPDVEVVAVVTGALEAFVAELERQETAIAAEHGRVIAAAFRRGRKTAQSRAATKLRELARTHLSKGDLADRIPDAGPPPD